MTLRSPDLIHQDFAFWGFLKAHRCMLLIAEIFRHLRQRIAHWCAAAHPSVLSKQSTNMGKRLGNCVDCWGNIQSI
jgi:hypothetical protein